MAKTVVIEVQVNDDEVKSLTSELDSLGANFSVVESNAKKVGKEVKNLGIDSKILTKMDSLTGGWASSVVDVVTGLKGVVKGLNLTKTALIATGIGAFVVILASVVAYWDDIKEAVTGVNVELQEQKELSDQINISLERRNQLEKDNARYVDIRTKERLLRAKIAGASEKELTQIEREGLEERLVLAEEYAAKANEILENSLGADEEAYLKAQENQIKAFDDLAKARSALGLFDLESQVPEKDSKGGRRKKERKVNPLTGEEYDKEQEEIRKHYEELNELEQIRKDTLQESSDAALERMLTSEEVAQARRTAIERAEAAERRRIAENEAAAKLAALDLVSNGLMAAARLAGEQTGAGKALAVASTLVTTYLSATQAFQSQFNPVADTSSPIRGALAAGAALASGLANVKSILSVKIPGGGGSSVASPSTPPAFNVVQASAQNQLNQSLLENNNEPVQAFVVDKEVTTQQELSRNKVESSSLG